MRTNRVPYLQLYLLILNIDQPSSKLNADGEVVHRLKSLVCELEEQAALPDACMPQKKSTEKQESGISSRWVSEGISMQLFFFFFFFSFPTLFLFSSFLNGEDPSRCKATREWQAENVQRRGECYGGRDISRRDLPVSPMIIYLNRYA